jgi:hypothetical protein
MATKAAPIGKYGVMPDKDNMYALETTVFTVGSAKSGWGFAIGLVHLITWLAALTLILTIGNNALGDVTGVTDSAKMLGMVYALIIIAILVVVVLHAMFAKKEEAFRSTMASVILLWLVFFELSLGCAYLAYSMSHDDFYGPAVICHLLVCGGCAMIVAFYVNFTHNGNLTATLLEGGSNVSPA